MLSIFEVLHACPVFLAAYCGFRLMFGHMYALAISLVIATVVIVCTTLAPDMIDKENAKNLKERREAQTIECVRANL